MSVDISEPEIYAIREKIHSKGDPTTWFLLQYDPSTSSPTLRVHSSGANPAVESIRARLEDVQDPVVFGYAEVGGKGLVVCYLQDSVGGVRRARAVVHSRAVASLFPDYSALLTVAHPSQLTDEVVIDKLGLHHLHNQPQRQQQQQLHHQQPPSHIPVPQSTVSHNPPAESPPVPLKDTLRPGPLAGQTPSPTSLASEEPSFPEPPSTGSRPESATHKQVPSHDRQSNSSSHSVNSAHSNSVRRSDSRGEGRGTPTVSAQETSHTHQELGLGTPTSAIMSTPSGKPAPLPLAPPLSLTNTQPHHQNQQHHVQFSPSRGSPRIVSAPQQLEMKGISSADYFPDGGRARKTSLTTRLGQLASFGKKSSQNNIHHNGNQHQSLPGSPSSPHAPFVGDTTGTGTGTPTSPVVEGKTKSPGSPTINRFMNSSLVKNFGRRSSGGAGATPSSPTSPGGPRMSGPPVPPKDENARGLGIGHDGNGNGDEYQEFGYTPSISSGPTPGHSTSNVNSRNQSYTQASYDSRNRPQNSQYDQQPRDKEGIHGLGMGMVPVGANSGEIARSPSAQRALFDVSQKSLRNESEIQERFRKELAEKERERNGNGGDVEQPAAGQGNGRLPAHSGGLEEDDEDIGLPYDRPDPDSPHRPQHAPTATDGSYSYTGQAGTSTGSGIESQPHQGLQRDIAGDEAVAERVAELDLAEDGHAGGTGVDMSIQAEKYAEERRLSRERLVRAQQEEEASKAAAEDQAKRVREEEERQRLEAEERIRFEQAQFDQKRLEEEHRERQLQEAEQAKLEAQRQAAAAEQARIKEEERLRAEEERRQEEVRKEAERLRAEEQERKRQNEEILRKEEEKKVREAEEAERTRKEGELRRKEGIKAGFVGAKQSGGVMLSGFITVQTTRATIWRRRWFALYSDRIDLLKTEGDAKPIQVIRLSSGTRISQVYEESQVQGSFKITQGDDGEEFFLFTDGSEEKELVLAALDVALGGV